MHDGRSAGEVCTESDTVRVTDANSGRHDVVDHAGKLVDAEHGHDAADAQTRANLLETFDGARAEVGPHDVAEQAELAVEVDTVGCDETVREEMEAQVDVMCVDRRLGEIGDGGAHDDLRYLASVVSACQQCKIGRNICSLDVLGTGLVECSQLRCREPGVEDGSVRGHVGDTYCCCSLCAHGTRDYWVVGAPA